MHLPTLSRQSPLVGLAILLAGTPAIAQMLPGQPQLPKSRVVDVPTGEPEHLRFAVIGDFGAAVLDPGLVAKDVADMVKATDPDLIITVGDNNYPSGEFETIDDNVGQFYAEYIHPYAGAYGPGGTVNRFFPCLGNHDWTWIFSDEAIAEGIQYPKPHFDYFNVPGDALYYEFTAGPVHFFALDSMYFTPGGDTFDSVQGQWLQQELANSTLPYRVVYFHHSPYSSGVHGNHDDMQWPFRDWGADIVFAGHDHTYERLEVDQFQYIVNGAGGNPLLYPFQSALKPESHVGFDIAHGAIIADVTPTAATFKFVTSSGAVIDCLTLGPDESPRDTFDVLVPKSSTWSYLDDGSDPRTDWADLTFDDSSWASGPAQLGYGDGDEATVVSFGEDELDKHVTTYFRHMFSLAEEPEYTFLRLGILRDDGVRVFVNGVDAYRSYLPYGDVGHDTYASLPAVGAEESKYVQTSLAPGLLKQGRNVIAVEVHQALPASSDLSFDLELIGEK